MTKTDAQFWATKLTKAGYENVKTDYRLVNSRIDQNGVRVSDFDYYASLVYMGHPIIINNPEQATVWTTRFTGTTNIA